MPKRYWLFKSEPDVFGIDALQRDGSAFWDGVRNYQARNFIRDDMQPGDLVLFYHSNADPTGIAGIAEITKAGYPDHTAFDPKDHHYDPKSKQDSPTWYMVDIKFVEKFEHLVTLDELKAAADKFEGLLVIKRGQRLSVQPVEKAHFEAIRKVGRGK
jgi:predicted RNA-binding protein with PUA-like domain